MRTSPFLGVAAAAYSCFANVDPACAQEIANANIAAADGNTTAKDDPWQPVNRRLYRASNFLDRCFLRPVAMTYRRVLPRPIRKAASNVVSNLGEPSVAINDVVQGRLQKAGTATARFAANTTIGFAGVFDVAANMGLLRHDNDFGITLGKWNLKAGPYIYVPVAGPSSVRDLAGAGVDFFLDPLGWIDFRDSDILFTSEAVVGGLDARMRVDKTLQTLNAIAVDPYSTLRSVYLQSRESKVHDDRVNMEALPDFPDDLQANEAPNGGADTPGASVPTPIAPPQVTN